MPAIERIAASTGRRKSLHMTQDVLSPGLRPTQPRMGVILVIDDEPAFCDVVCEILDAMGYQAHHAFNANQALALLTRVKPDLILTDVMMPDMDGLSFVRHLRSQADWHSTPIVIISAKTTPEDHHLALESGADVFLPKPFSYKDLERTISDILRSPPHASA